MNRDKFLPLFLIVGSIVVLIVTISIFGMAAQVSKAQAGIVAVQGRPITHTVTLQFDWGAGHITPTGAITISYGVVILEIRDRSEEILASQSKYDSCKPVPVSAPPDVGMCGDPMTFTVTMPDANYFTEHVKATFYDENEIGYDVPAANALSGPDERGFYMIGIVEAATPTPTATDTPTWTPTATGTVMPTYTPGPPNVSLYFWELAQEYRQLAEEHRQLAEKYDGLAVFHEFLAELME